MELTELILSRDAELPKGEGTPGRLPLPSGTVLHTLELPARGNQPDISCILPGTFTLRWGFSPHLKQWCYLFDDAETLPRKDVRLHTGNFAGDTSLGWQSDVLGCVLVGCEAGPMLNKFSHMQYAVHRSLIALSRLASELNHEPFRLTIKGFTS